MIAVIRRARAIRQQQAFVAPVVRLAHRRVNADVRRDARQHEVLNPPPAQQHVQIRRVKRPLARLVNHRLPRQRRQFRDDVPAGFPPRQNPAARAGIPDARTDAPAAPALVFRQIRQIRPVPLARVKNLEPQRPRGGEHVLNRPDGRAGQREVITHFIHIPARPAKIRLHVNDQDHRVLRMQLTVERPRIRIGLDVFFHAFIRRCPAPPAPPPGCASGNR